MTANETGPALEREAGRRKGNPHMGPTTTPEVQVTGSGVVLVANDRAGGYLADLDEIIARSCDSWSQGYSQGYHDGRTDRAVDEQHRQLGADLRQIAEGPEVTDMTGTADELRARAEDRGRADAARFRAGLRRHREAS